MCSVVDIFTGMITHSRGTEKLKYSAITLKLDAASERLACRHAERRIPTLTLDIYSSEKDDLCTCSNAHSGSACITTEYIEILV